MFTMATSSDSSDSSRESESDKASPRKKIRGITHPLTYRRNVIRNSKVKGLKHINWKGKTIEARQTGSGCRYDLQWSFYAGYCSQVSNRTESIPRNLITRLIRYMHESGLSDLSGLSLNYFGTRLESSVLFQMQKEVLCEVGSRILRKPFNLL